MGSATNYLESELLDHALGTGVAFSQPAQLYCALFENGSGPGEAGGGTEITGGSYGRVAVNFNPASAGSTSNSNLLSWTASGGNFSAPVGHIGLFDASTGGNILFYADLSSSKTVNDGDTLEIAIGNIVVTLS